MVGATSLGYPESMKVLNLCVSPAFKTGYCISNQNCHSSFQAKKSCLTINSFIQTHHAPTKPRTHDTRDPWPSCCLRVSFKKKFHLSSKCRWIQNHAGEELTSHLGCFSKTQKLTLVSSVFLHGNTLPLPKITHLLDIQTPWGLVFEVCCEKGAQSLPFTSRGGIFGCRLGQEIWMTNFPKQSVAETCHDFPPPQKKKEMGKMDRPKSPKFPRRTRPNLPKNLRKKKRALTLFDLQGIFRFKTQREVFSVRTESKGPERPSGHKWTWPLPTDPSRSLDWDHHRSSRCSWEVEVRGGGFVGFAGGWGLVGYHVSPQNGGREVHPTTKTQMFGVYGLWTPTWVQVKNGPKHELSGKCW